MVGGQQVSAVATMALRSPALRSLKGKLQGREQAHGAVRTVLRQRWFSVGFISPVVF